MAFKIILALAFVAVTSAGYFPAPQVHHSAQHHLTKTDEHYDHHPHYNFDYSVHDEHTGDIKSQFETRDGDVVKGEYSLIDSDGYKRVVKYTADHDHGFNAIVHREPFGHPLKAHTPVIKTEYSAPGHIKTAPVVYTTHSYVKSAPVALEAESAYDYSNHH